MAREPFRDNVVIITGASDGIGAEMALQLASQGARIVLAARDEARLNAVAAQCRQRGGQTLVVRTDVAVQAECEALVNRAVAEFGRIDTLVNNAGISMWARFDEMTTLEPFERMMQVNYMGAVYCTWYALPHLKRSRGRIVGVSSLTGRAGVPTRSGYGATKHAMAGFFDALRVELADEGVTVTMVYPGFVSTGIRQRAMGPDGAPLHTSPVRESRVMTPERCAALIIQAMAGRRRERVMTARARVGQWIKLIAPGVVDRIARRAIERGE